MPTFAKAGRYHELLFAGGALAPGTSVTVRLPGTSTAATLWTSRDKTTAAANPVAADASGNLSFFADPGYYDLFANGVTVSNVLVPGDPELPAPNGTYALLVLTMAGLRATTATAGAMARLVGYTAAGDGGGGLFRWDTTSAAADNGGTIIAVTGVTTGRWLRVVEGPFDVKWFGATGNGSTVDTTAVQATFAAAGAGGGVYFSKGVFHLSGLAVSNLAGLTVYAHAQAVIKRERSAAPDTARFGFFDTCDDLTLRGLTFDLNGIERFGGLNIDNSKRVRVLDCTAYDSALNASWATYDHYWLVIQSCTDVWVNQCSATDVELVEADNCDRVKVKNNLSVRCAGTAAIGGFSVSNGYYFRNYEISDNLIVNPRKSAIVFQNESGGPLNAEFRRIFIRRNTVIRDDPAIAGDARDIAVGNFTGVASTGNVFDQIRVEDNDFVLGPTMAMTKNCVAFLHTQSSPVFTRTRFARNTQVVRAGGTRSDWAFDLRRLQSSYVTDNITIGGAYGIVVENLSRSIFARNLVNATNTAYQVTSGGDGDNVFELNRIEGTPSTTWSTTFATSDVLRNNQGLNPLGVQFVSVGASPWTYTNNTGTAGMLYLRAGTVSSVAKNGRTVFAATPCGVWLEPSESVTVTYSSAPAAEFGRT